VPGPEQDPQQGVLGMVRLIEQAKGILMAQNGCSAEEAFDLLRLASQRGNVKVHVLAERLIEKVTSRQPPADRR
jgi:AmiR/NasT family two-component response regulator